MLLPLLLILLLFPEAVVPFSLSPPPISILPRQSPLWLLYLSRFRIRAAFAFQWQQIRPPSPPRNSSINDVHKLFRRLCLCLLIRLRLYLLEGGGGVSRKRYREEGG